MGTITNRYLNEVHWQQPGDPKLRVTGNAVHVWRICISKNLKRLEQFEALLNPEETLRAGRYKQQKDTYRFIISRGMQRIILGRYLDLLPAALQFVLGDNKKPHVVGNNGDTIHYNLSHSGDWILLAIAASPIGTDVEFIDNNFSFRDILPDNFSNDEIAYINHDNAAERFFTLWTRKEAILKATGQGLGEHLQLTPSLDGEHTLSRSVIGADKNWQLNSFLVNPGYIGSVAAEDAGQFFLFFDANT
ncbi:4'-phosphopantetheinyl transferase superfamily protein [Mucilaginibacter terrigena]|uniref:4'-phosphopantetheinyl transferase superfamily protein n=1 Tax=Mucilaginibacter terrigena TaxID=2492395 RepID=A0A4Q5LPH1_9SPHI|nr:4'-phosphopantetheinyl transferase superfamily protein [Mucilaginibacter terrigena]RYU91301.1 4'-phosphopantetheinyl transferase superfamily protein [Mucilaginibacter terrigena]